MKRHLSRIFSCLFVATLFASQSSMVLAAQDDVGVVEGRVVNVSDPIDEQDAATKNYVDNLIDGIPEMPAVLQSTGKSKTAIMSQQAVTNAIDAAQNTLASELNETQIPVVTTTGSNTDLIATVPDWEVAVGKMIVIIPHVTGTSNTITLNVNSDGAKTFTCTDSSGASASFASTAPILTSGIPVLIVRGATQWNVLNISKPNVNSVNGTLPIANGGTGATTASDARTNLSVYSKAEVDSALTKQAIGNMMYPVGSIYISISSTNPSTLFGGTWSAWGQGRVPLGMGSNGTTNYTTVEAINSSSTETHTLTSSQMPSHDGHIPNSSIWWPDAGEDTYILSPSSVFKYSTNRPYVLRASNEIVLRSFSEGSSQAHNNMQPYITCYMWKRTA